MLTAPSVEDDQSGGGADDNKRPGALLPSELKKLLRSKRSKTTPSSCTRVTPIPTSAFPLQPTERIPLGKISPNIVEKACLASAPALAPIIHLPEFPSLSHSLLTQMTISCGPQIAHWKQWTACNHGSVFESYRFSYPDVPSDAPLKLRKLLSLGPTPAGNSSTQNSLLAFEQAYFKALVDSWRKALLSLYDLFRARRCKYFYYLQPDHVIIFYRNSNDDTAEALIARATPSLISKLRAEGIPFAGAPEESLTPLLPSTNRNDGDNHESDNEHNLCGNRNGSDTDDSASSPVPNVRAIKAAINQRVNQTRRRASHRAGTAAPNLTVRGEHFVHSLIDYLLNQRDGRSYVILPQLIAPVSFLFGTQVRADFAISGPLDASDTGGDSLYQVRISGLLLPSLQEYLIRETYRPNDRHFKLTTTADPRTEPFLSSPYAVNI